jgi:hypothetical protein
MFCLPDHRPRVGKIQPDKRAPSSQRRYLDIHNATLYITQYAYRRDHRPNGKYLKYRMWDTSVQYLFNKCWTVELYSLGLFIRDLCKYPYQARKQNYLFTSALDCILPIWIMSRQEFRIYPSVRLRSNTFFSFPPYRHWHVVHLVTEYGWKKRIHFGCIHNIF